MKIKDRFRPFAAVYVLFVRNDKILMARRAHTGYQDGMYSLPAGHIDGNETLRAAAVREAREETGATIAQRDLELKLTMHRIHDREYLDVFFLVKKWRGTMRNREPHKCDDLSWFPLNAIPKNTIPYVREAIRCYRKGIRYSEFGWAGR